MRARFGSLFVLFALLSGALVSGVTSAHAVDRVDVFIGFNDRPGAAEQAFVARNGGVVKHTYSLVPAIAASIPENAVDRIRANRNVTHVEPDLEVHALSHSTEVGNTWGVDRIEADLVHHGGTTGSGVKVGVLDSGIDTDHPDLAWDSTCSWNFVAGTSVPEDGGGHGTHTAGTVGALLNGSAVVGAAPSATLCIYKVLSDSGSGSYSDVVAALERAVVDGVRVTNNSYGSSGDPGTTVKSAFDNAAAAGVLHVAAAGNAGNPPGKGDNCGYPALWDSVVAVAATTSSDSRASYSSTCVELELAAPGSSVNSTTNDGGTGTMSGTSMASPHVAGTAALVLSAETGLSASQVRQRLQETAEDLGSTGRDTRYGFGLVRADLATASSGSSEPAPTGSVSGTVTDASTSSALEGATVTVDTGQSTTTGTDGSYTIVDVPTGDRSVTASATGYDSQTAAATVNENQTTIVDFALNATPVGSTATVSSITYSGYGGPSSDKHVLITATVVDDSGQPVSGASVSISVDRDGAFYGSATGTTGSDGTVTFEAKNAPSGCYETTVTGVTASGLTWDGATPANSYCKS